MSKHYVALFLLLGSTVGCQAADAPGVEADAGTAPGKGDQLGDADVDPFDPQSCAGPAMTEETALAFFGAAETRVDLIEDVALTTRWRECTSVSCSEWKRCQVDQSSYPNLYCSNWEGRSTDFWLTLEGTSENPRVRLNYDLQSGEWNSIPGCHVDVGGDGLGDCQGDTDIWQGGGSDAFGYSFFFGHLGDSCVRLTSEQTADHYKAGLHLEFEAVLLGHF